MCYLPGLNSLPKPNCWGPDSSAAIRPFWAKLDAASAQMLLHSTRTHCSGMLFDQDAPGRNRAPTPSEGTLRCTAGRVSRRIAEDPCSSIGSFSLSEQAVRVDCRLGIVKPLTVRVNQPVTRLWQSTNYAAVDSLPKRQVNHPTVYRHHNAVLALRHGTSQLFGIIKVSDLLKLE